MAARVEKRYRPWAVEHIMVRLGHNLGLALLLAAGLCLAAGTSPATQTAAPSSGASATSSHPQKAHAHRKKTAPAVETPQPPPAPLTPEQMSPTPPQVTYQNGLLTIDARNSTLSQVLRAVQARTGAAVEMPSSAANERVMMQVGPGRARDVLNTLLNGSKFDYIILGMADNPGGVQKVVLITRQNAATAVNTAQSSVPGHAQPQYQPPDEPQDEEMPTEVEPDNPPQSPQGMPMPGRFRPGQVPMPQPDTNPEPVPDNGNPPNGRKTPEQLLQELQTMQQQQQQYQQQLNPANVEGEPQPPQ
jgi:guanyl-specific ribonuclease Sa